jgi:hypothetical protein
VNKRTAEVVEPSETGLVITQMQPGLDIEANFEALQKGIAKLIECYQGAVITREYVPQAKRDRAYLNSLSKSLNQRRLDVKQQYMAPIVAFENRVKVLDAPIKEASEAIDVQIKAFEERERVEKRAEIVKHWQEYAGALADAVGFERIEDPAWLNKSMSLMAVFEAVEKIVERIAADEAALTDLNLSHPIEAKAEYFATLDMSRAIARSKSMDEMEERARKLEAEKAEIAAAREEQAPAPAPPAAPAQPPRQETIPAPESAPEIQWTFFVCCTRAEIEKIVEYAVTLGVHGNVTRADR